MNITDIFAQHNLAIQEASYTCGPVSLLNVLRLKGDLAHNESDLAKLCNAKLGIGTSHADLVRAAQKLGLRVVSQKSNAIIKDIEDSIDDAAYVIVNYTSAYSGITHYAVVTEYDDAALYLRDCSYGFIRLEKQYFKKFWHGDESKQWYAAVR